MTTVVFLHSAMTGAPVLSGQAGKMLDVLNACLVDGWGTATVDSVVISGGVATVTRSGGHPFEADMVSELAGATVSGGSINGRRKVLSITSTTYTFDATGIPNQTATGTITHKVAAAAWTRPIPSAGNVAVYKSPNVAATGAVLRVDDTGTTFARVVGYESMSDLNTGIGPFPTAAQISGGMYWGKSSTADATARGWVFFGNDRTFYLYVAYTAGTSASHAGLGFGDFISEKSPDPYSAFLSGHSTNGNAAGAGTTNDLAYVDPLNAAPFYYPRGASGVGSAVQGRKSALVPIGSAIAGYSGQNGAAWMGYPNPGSNGLYLSPLFVSESPATPALRGRLPGFYVSPQTIGLSAFANRERSLNVASLPSRAVRSVMSSAGPSFVDVTGPWV